MSDITILIGHTIKDIKLNQQKFNNSITFITSENQKLVFDAYAMCCSESWIESVEGAENLIGQEVLSINEKEDEEKKGHMDYVQLLNIDINTCKGTCTIEFRNNHNGYYGGSLNLRKEKTQLEDINNYKRLSDLLLKDKGFMKENFENYNNLIKDINNSWSGDDFNKHINDWRKRISDNPDDAQVVINIAYKDIASPKDKSLFKLASLLDLIRVLANGGVPADDPCASIINENVRDNISSLIEYARKELEEIYKLMKEEWQSG